MAGDGVSDKNSAIIEYLLQCPSIGGKPTFFNFINAEDNNKQIITVAQDVYLHTPYIDGTVMKRYVFTLVDYKSISYNAIVQMNGYSDLYPDENVEEILEVQNIIDWITQQNDARHYPDFGDKCIVENIRALTDTPNLNGVDTSIQPALARYSVSIQVDYLDTSKQIWN